MSTPMSAAQSAQQSNRGPGGQYSFGTHTEPDGITLDRLTQSALLTEPGTPAAMAYDLNEAGFKGRLSPEQNPDDNLHEAAYPQYRYTTPSNRSFTVSVGRDAADQDEVFHVADSDYRDEEGYVIHYGEAGDSVASVMQGAVRTRVAWEHGADAFTLEEGVEFRAGEVTVKDGKRSAEVDFSDDEGDWFTVEYSEGEISSFSHTTGKAFPSDEEDGLYRRIGGREGAAKSFESMISGFASDSDLDEDMTARLRG